MSRQAFGAWLRSLRVGVLLAATIGVLLGLAALGIAGCLIANSDLSHDRELLLEKVGPTLRAELNLDAALVNQETGVRGYVLARDRSFLAPYDEGLSNERAAFAVIEAHTRAVGPPLGSEIALVRRRVREWRQQYVAPELMRASTGGGRSLASSLQGRERFDAIRSALLRFRETIEHKDVRARAKLNSAASTLHTLLILAAILVLGSVLAAGLVLRRTVTRPLARLESSTRGVTGGRLGYPMPEARGPREISTLSREIEAMRARIVSELELVEEGRATVESQAYELQRSNAELEQFAYVASHDLQEPLRKVASFCQALQSRYGGQLDERADQYIDFAVDGAKRMQTLINDLLAFSRVGRGELARDRLELAEIVAEATATFAERIEQQGARITVGELPAVMGDRALLGSLFENLIGNALKFHGEQPPQITIESIRQGADWVLSFADNGIGIEAEYAERVFLIFQRLHTRETFEGSGIGLALCRKIVEYHGGRIWLDTDHSPGARLLFTLPAIEELPVEG